MVSSSNIHVIEVGVFPSSSSFSKKALMSKLRVTGHMRGAFIFTMASLFAS
jgi:hypothetical protein